MKVIVIEEEAFYELIEQVVDRIAPKISPTEKKWLSTEEAMKELGITSSTTLQRYRDEGKIRYTQPSKRIILYDPESIQTFLESNAKNTF